MLTRKKALITAATIMLLALAGASYATHSLGDNEWTVVAVGLPDKVSTSVANINMGSYLLRQTHEPLFRNDMDGHYYSNILSKWSREKSPDRYVFCVDESHSFHQGRAFGVDDLEKVISRLDSTFLGVHSITKLSADRCVSVEATDPQLQVLNALADYWNAPTLATDSPKIEEGLGPYKAVSIDATQIILKRKSTFGSGFSSIRMANIRSLSGAELTSGNVEDMNSSYIESIPASIKSSYAYYDLPLLATIELLVNVEDENLRALIWNCTDIENLRHTLMPNQKTFRNIASVVPTGIPGARSGRVSQDCSGALSKYKSSHPRLTNDGRGSRGALRFLNWKADASEGMHSFWSGFTKKTGIPVEIEDVDENKMAESIFKVPHLFDLTIVSLAAVRSDRMPFLEFFFRPDQAAVDYVETLKSKVEKRTQKDWRLASSDELVEAVQGSFAALPLYQQVRRFYYPKDISGFDFSQNLIQYPEVIRLHR